MRARSFLSLAAAGVLTLGCTPKEGGSCDSAESHCLAADTQLVCEKGRFVATPCRGPAGCARVPEGIACDISKNRAGDRCATGEEGVASCAAKDVLVVCRGGSYRWEPCRGPSGCQRLGRRAACDTRVARAGDACPRPGEQACSADGTRLLACRDGKMTAALSCRGQSGCRVAGKSLECDLSRAAPGDACEPGMEGRHACSADESGTVVCRAGAFAADESCGAGKRCNPETVRCERR